MQCCARCGREVYSAEQKLACNKVWHSFCFSCYKCGKLLDSCSVNPYNGEIYCNSCYKHLCSSCSASDRPPITLCNPCFTPCDPCPAPNPCERLCIPCTPCTSIGDCCPKTIILRTQSMLKTCTSGRSDTQCCTCLDECEPPTRMYRCRAQTSGCCKPRRCSPPPRCFQKPCCSASVPREVANYYNRNHDRGRDSCCQGPCCKPKRCCSIQNTCEPCAAVECTPPKSCCPPSNFCAKCCVPMKSSPPHKCGPPKCFSPTKCCAPTKCNSPTKCCPASRCCQVTKCCSPTKCGPPSGCMKCPPKPSPPTSCCPLEPSSCGPCQTECSSCRCRKPVCYPPVKCCEPQPEEIICFQPANSFPQPKCCSCGAPNPCKCDLDCRRRMAIYCNTPCCRRCGHKVYAAEKVQIAGSVFHSCCFSCFCCGKSLDVTNVYENQGEIHCKSCYCKYFGIQGYGSSY